MARYKETRILRLSKDAEDWHNQNIISLGSFDTLNMIGKTTMYNWDDLGRTYMLEIHSIEEAELLIAHFEFLRDCFARHSSG